MLLLDFLLTLLVGPALPRGALVEGAPTAVAGCFRSEQQRGQAAPDTRRTTGPAKEDRVLPTWLLDARRETTSSDPFPALFQPILDKFDLGRVQPEGGADLLIGSPGHQHLAGGLCFGLGVGQDACPLPPV